MKYMARFEWANQSRWKCWSYKRTTFVICSINLIAALYAIRSLYSSMYISSTRIDEVSNSFSGKFTSDQMKVMEESLQLRQEFEPKELVNLLKGLKGHLSRGDRVLKVSSSLKLMITLEIMKKLKGLEPNTSLIDQRVALENWRKEKLEETKKLSRKIMTSNSTIPREEARAMKKALERDWFFLLEDIGLWIPPEVNHTEINDKPENEPEFEDQIIAGRPMPPECHAELHTDYAGAAVRWGLTHHKESAADCCQACLDQAKRAKIGEIKCNIWVYCPSEPGCYSPDIYRHRHQECWLKYAEKPKLNFKDQYSESYRNSHPTAPVVVPWMSGVITN